MRSSLAHVPSLHQVWCKQFYFTAYSEQTAGQTLSADGDHVIWLKAPEQLLNGACGETVFSTVELWTSKEKKREIRKSRKDKKCKEIKQKKPKEKTWKRKSVVGVWQEKEVK